MKQRVNSDYAAVTFGPWRAIYGKPQAAERYARITTSGYEIAAITVTADFTDATLTTVTIDQRIPEVPYTHEHTAHDIPIYELLAEGDTRLLHAVTAQLTHTITHQLEPIEDPT